MPADTMFEPISDGELATAQFHKACCVEIRRRLSKRAVLPLGDVENRIPFRQITHDQVVTSHPQKPRVLLIHHYARLAEHPGEKSYASLFVTPSTGQI